MNNNVNGFSMPELNGSINQVILASEIREKLFSKYLVIEAYAKEHAEQHGYLPDFCVGSEKCRKLFQRITEASFYIDNFNCSIKDFLANK